MRSTRAWQDDSEIFRWRRARPVARWERWVLGILLFLGLQSVVFFALWWFRAEHVGNLPLFVLLSFGTWYGISRMLVGWYNVFHIEQPSGAAGFSPPERDGGLKPAVPLRSVAIF